MPIMALKAWNLAGGSGFVIPFAIISFVEMYVMIIFRSSTTSLIQ